MHRILRVCLLGAVCLACGWIAVEPEVAASDQKAKSAPQEKSQKQYELRVIRVADGFASIRFQPATGKAWYINRDKWVPIPETGNVPAGDYDVILVPLERSFTASRLERGTGATWMMREDKWFPVKEPE